MNQKKASAASAKTPTQLLAQSAWAKGSPQSNSSSASSPRSQSPAPSHPAISHSRRPSVLSQDVSVKYGVALPRNVVGSVRPASVVFGSINDASAPLPSSPASTPAVTTEAIKFFGTLPVASSNYVNGKSPAPMLITGSPEHQPAGPSTLLSSDLSTTSNTSTLTYPPPKPTFDKAYIARLFQNTSSLSLQSSSGTSPLSTRLPNLPSRRQPSSTSHLPPQPSQLGKCSHPQFVFGMRQPQQGAGIPRSPAFPRAVVNIPAQSRPRADSGGPGGPPISASPPMVPCQHQAPLAIIAPHAPIQPMQRTGCYYPMDPNNQPPHQYDLHTPSRSPIPISPHPATSQLPATPITDAIPDPPHIHPPPQSISFPQTTPSASNAPHPKTNPSDFAPERRRSVDIKNPDGTELTFDALKKYRVAPVLGADLWFPTNAVRKAQPDIDSSETDREVKVLLEQLTMDKFDSISDLIILWTNRCAGEKDGRTLSQVTQLVFEKAIHEAALSEMYARLCRKMMGQISPDVKDNMIKSYNQPLAGGLLFQKYLLSRCQECFDHAWVSLGTTDAMKTSADQAIKAVSEEDGNREAGLHFDDVRIAKRKAFGVIKFIGELFKLRMLSERMMHEYVEKLFGIAENPEEERVEGLCLLLETVGQFLDIPTALVHMDIYIMRMKEMSKSTNLSYSMQFMLQGVIELRERKWVGQNAIAAPVTITVVDKAKEPLWIDKPSMHMPLSNDIHRSHCGLAFDHASEKREFPEESPSSLRIACAILNLSEVEYPEGIKRPSAELDANVASGRFRYDRDFLMQFMHICKEKPPTLTLIHNLGIERVDQSSFPMAHSSSGCHRSTSNTVSRSIASESVDPDIGISKVYDFQSMGSKLVNEQYFSPDNGTALRGGPSQGSSGGPNDKKKNRTRTKRGAPQNALLSRQRQSSYLEESIPTSISEVVKRQIDEDVKEFFAARDLKEADAYLPDLPREHRFRFVEKLVTFALESEEAEAKLVAEFFARAASNGQCSLKIFKKGFIPIIDDLDEIAIDAPKAFYYMSIMLKGAGLKLGPDRKLRAENKLVSLVTPAENVGGQEPQTDSSLHMFYILDQAPKPAPEAAGRSEPGSSMCNTVDQNPEALLRKRLDRLPRFRPRC